MDVHVVDFVAGAREARGVAIVIDVFRAATLQCHAIAQGAGRVIPVAEEAVARQFKRANPAWLLCGERFARKLPGFDYGNSPSDIAALDLTGRTVIHTTHAGTQGLAAATGADTVLSAALVNARATAAWAASLRPREVFLVRMGSEATERTLEDDLCAEYLRALLTGQPCDTASFRSRLALAPSARKFFDPACDWAPEADFTLCTEVDRFGFALQLEGRQSASPWLAARTVL